MRASPIVITSIRFCAGVTLLCFVLGLVGLGIAAQVSRCQSGETKLQRKVRALKPPPVVTAPVPLQTVETMYTQDEQQRKAEWQQVGHPLMRQFVELGLPEEENGLSSKNPTKREAAKEWLQHWGKLPVIWAHPKPRPWEGLEVSSQLSYERDQYADIAEKILQFIDASCETSTEFDVADRIAIARSTVAFSTLGIAGLSQAGVSIPLMHEWHTRCDATALCWLDGASGEQADSIRSAVATLRTNWHSTAPGSRR